MTASTVAGLRSQGGNDNDNPRLTALVGELAVKSPEFASLWARHDVRHKDAGRSLIVHPVVGVLDLRYEKLAVGESSSGQVVVIYHADPGSPTETNLALLNATATEP